jgi:hypothetical protein
MRATDKPSQKLWKYSLSVSAKEDQILP